MRVVCSFFVLLAVALSLAESPSDFYGPSDSNILTGMILSDQNEGGGFGTTLEETFQSIWSLTLLNKGEEINAKDSLCKRAIGELSSSSSQANTLFYSLSIVDLLECPFTPSEMLFAAMESALQSDNLNDLYFGSLSVAKLSKKGLLTEAFDKETVSHAVSVFETLQELGEGAFKQTADDEGGVEEAGKAFEALGELWKANLLEEEDKERVNEMAADFLSISDVALEERGSLSFEDREGHSSLIVTTHVTKGVAAFSGILEEAPFSDEQINALANYFINNRQVGDRTQGFYVLSGLHALASSPTQKPLVLSVPRSSLLARKLDEDNEGFIEISVTDLFGNFAIAANVNIDAVLHRSRKKTEPLHTDIKCSPASSDADNTLFTFDFLALKPDPGYYRLEVSAVSLEDKDAGYIPVSASTRIAKIVGSITVYDVEFGLSEEEDQPTYSVQVGESLDQKLTLEYKPSNKLWLQFRAKNQVSGKGVVVQQAFIRLYNKSADEEFIYLAAHNKKLYSLLVTPQQIGEHVHFTSGDYQLQLIVGDSFVQNSAWWTLATIAIRFPKKLAQVPEAEMFALPEIQHQFREPEKRPTESVSLIFTALIMSPLMLLFVMLFVIGVDFKLFPRGVDAISALCFEFCIMCILGLYAVFWFKINMFTTLRYLGFLSVPTIFFGHRTLRAVALAERATAKGAKSKAD